MAHILQRSLKLQYPSENTNLIFGEDTYYIMNTIHLQPKGNKVCISSTEDNTMQSNLLIIITANDWRKQHKYKIETYEEKNKTSVMASTMYVTMDDFTHMSLFEISWSHDRLERDRNDWDELHILPWTEVRWIWAHS